VSTPLEISHRFGIVAILDGLGTKAIPDNDVPKNIEMTDRLRLRIEKAVYLANKHVITTPTVHHEVRAFQDTFIVTVSVDQNEMKGVSEDRLLRRTADILTPLYIGAMAHGIWIRGAFSIGEFYSARFQVKGPAVSDAGNYYEKHKWVGIAAAQLSEKSIVSIISKDKQISEAYVQWDLSTGTDIDRRYVLNWMNKSYYQDIDGVLKANGLTYESLAEGALKTIDVQMSNSTGDIRIKWAKTRAFFEKMI
jgi:hypothetical protein